MDIVGKTFIKLFDFFYSASQHPFLKPVLKGVLLFFKPVGWIFTKLQLFQDIKANEMVRKFEKENRYEEARKVRKEWIERLPFAKTGFLWHSEGEDRLYNLKDHKGALEAFEKSMESSKYRGEYIAVVNPLNLYYGASVASVRVGNLEKAEKYYNELMKWKDILQSGPDLHLEKYISRYDEGLKWLQEQITGHKK